MYSVSRKCYPTPSGFLAIFPEWLRIFQEKLYTPIVRSHLAKVKKFVELSLILTAVGLWYIKRDYLVVTFSLEKRERLR